jgi:heme ABC exporter ATP-binding subunit CcmA
MVDSITEVVVERVTRSFGTTVALRGVSLRFDSGEIVTLEGHNGSGKSTLLAILGTLLRPTGGTVEYGRVADATNIRSQIGWVSHETHCYPDLTPRENVLLAAGIYGVGQRAAWERARMRFGLSSFEDRALRLLSRGQRQRVALARALVHAPSLVLLDEPTTGLDRDGVASLVQVVREEAARRAIVIFVTHDAVVAELVATRRVLLDRGRIVRDAAVLSSPGPVPVG